MLGQRLNRARKAAGLSLRDLAAKVNLSHAAIKKYEDGGTIPSSDILIEFSKALKVRTEYFFRPMTLSLAKLNYRKKSTLPVKQLDAITHEVIDRAERRMELESLFPQPISKPFKIDKSSMAAINSLDDIELSAEALRHAWNLGEEPIPDLVDVLENNGIRVFMVEHLTSQQFDGLAAMIEEQPIVVIGSNWPGDRQRFTLAHELGHLILEGRLGSNMDEEKACDRFAGAFLFPARTVRQELGSHRTSIEVKELSILKEEFGMSMMSILYRARDGKIITPSYHQQMSGLFKKKGWCAKEPGQSHPPEKAHLFDQLVFHALAEAYIGESKAAELLSLPLTEFRTIRAMGSHDAFVN